MHNPEIKNIIEAVLMAYGQPLSIQTLQNIFEEEGRPSIEEIQSTLIEIQNDYATKGIELKNFASGYGFQTRAQYSLWVSRIFAEKPVKYSSAFMEILAIIAYRQPVTRAEIDIIRGVSSSNNILRNILERGWIKIEGYKDAPGKPPLYVTTDAFLDYFHLTGLDALPSIGILENDK